MIDNKIHVRLRLIIIKNGKLLTSYSKKHDFYFYIGGHLEFGETIKDGCIREIKEECGEDTNFEFKKIVYIRDFIYPQGKDDINDHSVELFILGDINKFEELEGHLDPQHPDGSMYLSWLDINNLPQNLYPQELSKIIVDDYLSGFTKTGEYVGALK